MWGNWTMALTELEIRTAKAVERPLKLFDGGGLYLLVTQVVGSGGGSSIATREGARDFAWGVAGCFAKAGTDLSG